MQKIKFSNKGHKRIAQELKDRVGQITSDGRVLRRAYVVLWIKLLFYLIAFVTSFITLILADYESLLAYTMHYAIFGLLGILLAFNAAHDASHGTFSKNQFVNAVIFRFTFNINGVNSYLWKIRHIASHHLFPNVDGTDADLDESVLLRLSPSHRKRILHRYQHIYATFLYMFYTLHWIFYKDFLYLRKKNLSNLKDIEHSRLEVFRFFFWKLIYLMVYVGIPLYVGYSWQYVFLAFVFMHLVISVFFVWTLIISHLTCETAFPQRDETGVLPMNYYEHQLATAMDFRPKSILMNWFLGGFNAHAAHHLYPKWPHTMNRHITYAIQRTAVKFRLPYHSSTFIGALKSHYRYLKQMGQHKCIQEVCLPRCRIL